MTKVGIIGAGTGGRASLEMFTGDPTVAILGIADVNPWAPNIAVATDLRELVSDPRLDLIHRRHGQCRDRASHPSAQPPHTEVKAVSRAQE